jgi:hypothetical protein
MVVIKHFLMRYYILAISVLFLVSCSEKDIYEWKYYTTYDELDEQTTFLSEVYATTNPNIGYPYENAEYFLQIKTIIPDRIKTFDEYLDYMRGTQTNLINIKCIGYCPSFSGFDFEVSLSVASRGS